MLAGASIFLTMPPHGIADDSDNFSPKTESPDFSDFKFLSSEANAAIERYIAANQKLEEAYEAEINKLNALRNKLDDQRSIASDRVRNELLQSLDRAIAKAQSAGNSDELEKLMQAKLKVQNTDGDPIRKSPPPRPGGSVAFSSMEEYLRSLPKEFFKRSTNGLLIKPIIQDQIGKKIRVKGLVGSVNSYPSSIRIYLSVVVDAKLVGDFRVDSSHSSLSVYASFPTEMENSFRSIVQHRTQMEIEGVIDMAAQPSATPFLSIKEPTVISQVTPPGLHKEN